VRRYEKTCGKDTAMMGAVSNRHAVSTLARQMAIVVCCALFAALAAGQEARGEAKPARLFEKENTIEVSITAPWRELVRDDDYQDSYPATIEFTDELGNTESLDLTVERRGVTRQRVCKIPPVKLRFDKKDVKGTTFRGQESLKMVTHCESSAGYEQYYILEFLAYRVYNLLTEFSFRVRPLTATYLQAGSEDEEKSGLSFFKKKTSEGPVFAFLIEEDKDVANRHDLKNLHIPKIGPKQLDSEEAALYALFQFLISNIDWAATMGPDPEECCHNTKLIGPEPTTPEDTLYAIPYDFDSSGLVDSDYAAPPEGVPIRSVTQRLYRGYCAHNQSLENARQRMLENEQAIYALFRDEERLDAGKRSKALRFLEEGFMVFKDDNEFRTEIVERCR
jgi:hypothetical protein